METYWNATNGSPNGSGDKHGNMWALLAPALTGYIGALSGVLLAPFSEVIWDAVVIALTALFGVKKYIISENDKVNAFMKRVKDAKHVLKSGNLVDGGDGNSSGLLVGYARSLRFVAWIPTPSAVASGRDPSVTIMLWTRQPVSRFTGGDAKASGGAAAADADDEDAVTMTLWEAPAYYYCPFNMVQISFRMEPTPDQVRVVREIIEMREARLAAKNWGGIIVLVSGSPGAGKSKVAPLLARAMCLKGKDPQMTKTYNPTEAGRLRDPYSKAQPTRERPFVVLLDEIDIILGKVSRLEIKQNKEFRTEVFDKPTWNSFCDRVESDFENLVVVLTSNLTRDAINAMLGDDSFLRDKRVHYYTEMNNKVA